MPKKICNILIQLGIISLTIFPPVLFGAIRPLYITYIQGIILGIGLAWTVKSFIHRSVRYIITPLDLPFLTLLGWGIVNFITSTYRHSTEREVYLFAFYGLLYFLVVQQLKTVRRIVGLAFIIVLVGCGESLFGLFQYLQGATTILGHATPNIGTVNATYFSHNHFAGFLILIIPIAIALLLSTASIEKRFFILLLIGVMGTALVLSLSRGGLLSFILAVGGACICLCIKNMHNLQESWQKYVLISVLLLLILSALVMFVGLSPIAHRSLLQTFLPSKELFEREIRFSIWSSALNLIKEFPLFGSGLGTFEFVFLRHAPPQIPQNTQAFHAHNDYLELWIEMGFIALLLVFWAIIRLYRYVLHSYFHQNDPVLTSLALGGLTSATAILLHSFWDFNLQIPANATLFFIILALTSASVQLMTRGYGGNGHRKKRSSDQKERRSTSQNTPIYQFRASWIFGIAVLGVLTVLGFHFRTSLASTYFSEAKTFHNQGILFPSIPWYHKAINVDKSNARFHESFGQLYTDIARQTPHADKWYHLAIPQFQQAITLNNYHAAYYYQLGWIYAALNMEQEAIDLFLETIAYDPRTSFYYENLGNYYLSLRMTEPAMEMYQQALEYHPQRLKDLIESCLAYELDYTTYRQLVSDNAEMRKHFADVLAAEGFWTDSKLEYRKAIELSGHDSAYYEAMLEACRRKRDYQCRQQLWQELWEQDPKNLDYPLQIAESFEKQQQWEKAIELYQQLLETNPEFHKGYWRLAKIYQQQGQMAKALDIYTQLLKRRPDDARVYHRLAEIHSRQKNWGSAIQVYTQALHSGLNDTEIYHRLGTLYLQNGQKTQAITHYEQAVQKGETEITVYQKLERLYQEQGNTLGAEFIWENYTLTNKQQSKALFKLVQHYHKQREWLKAVTLVKEVIANAPTEVGYRKFLASLYEEKGMLEETIAQYRRILRIQPDNHDAQKQLARLGR